MNILKNCGVFHAAIILPENRVMTAVCLPPRRGGGGGGGGGGVGGGGGGGVVVVVVVVVMPLVPADKVDKCLS
jgi:predicted metalloprotease